MEKAGEKENFFLFSGNSSRGFTVEFTEVPKLNNAGYDFQCKRPGSRNALRVSVKVVTDEIKNGTQLRLKASPLWDVFFVVLLTKELLHTKALAEEGLPGHVTVTLQTHYKAVKAAHDRVRDLRDSLVAK